MNLSNDVWKIIEQKVENKNLKMLSQNFKNISSKYMGNKDSETLINNSDEVLSYCISRMPATYCVVHNVFSSFLDMLKKLDVELNVKTLLDVGLGTGATTLAVLNNYKVDEIKCIEKEHIMSDMALEFLKNENISLYNEDVIKLAESNEEQKNFKSDLVICSYMLNELSEKDLLPVVDFLWENTEKYLIIVDPGTPSDYERMMKIREHLINQKGIIIAPCAHNKPCKYLKENDWCAFSTRVERTKLQKEIKDADVPFEDEKFTYLIFSKEDINGQVELKRILRNPEITKNFIDLKICSKDGIKEERITKSKVEDYKIAKKAKNGDLI